jgi:hypothetical protein
LTTSPLAQDERRVTASKIDQIVPLFRTRRIERCQELLASRGNTPAHRASVGGWIERLDERATARVDRQRLDEGRINLEPASYARAVRLEAVAAAELADGGEKAVQKRVERRFLD